MEGESLSPVDSLLHGRMWGYAMHKGRKNGEEAFVPKTDHQIGIRPAASRDELEQAYRLVYGSYLSRGYIEPDASGMRLTLFNMLPDAVTFVAVCKGLVIATVSLIPDTTAGLPMEEIYGDELQQLRAEGRHLSEVTMLADRRAHVRRTFPMLLALMKLVFDYAQLSLKANDLCITINPRHKEYYERYLLFQELGGLRSYPSVRNNPAIARRLDLDTVLERCKGNERLLKTFYKKRTPRKALDSRYRMTPEDVACFAQLSTAVAEAPQALFDSVRLCFPDLPWHTWRDGAASG